VLFGVLDDEFVAGFLGLVSTHVPRPHSLDLPLQLQSVLMMNINISHKVVQRHGQCMLGFLSIDLLLQIFQKMSAGEKV